MRRSSKQYAEVFVRTGLGASAADLHKLTAAFVELLARENALSRFHEIVRLVGVLLERLSGKQDLVITTAAPLSAAAMTSLRHAATASGFAQVKNTVDEAIVGGVILRAGDRRTDHSVLGALNRLYETLTS